MKPTSLLIVLAFLICSSAFSQVNKGKEEETNKDAVFIVAESPPQFPGGDKARTKFIRKNLNYPSLEMWKQDLGYVVVVFFVDQDGGLSKFSVLKSLGDSFDEEALRVCKLMPKWIPSSNKEGNVGCYVNLPIRFDREQYKRKSKRNKSRR